MLHLNRHPDHRTPLTEFDQSMTGVAVAREAEAFLSLWGARAETPLVSLAGLAGAIGVGAIHVKDEGKRLGLGSFKALGGAYAVMRLVLEEAERRLGRSLAIADLASPEVRAVASTMTVGCATDGNHGRSVAAGAQRVGARAAIFVHGAVSEERIAAIARFGADIIRTTGTYDDSVAEAARVCGERGWLVVSDTAWPGYERIPSLVMQGYAVIAREALAELQTPPTHVFVQAGVGGIAAAMASYMLATFGEERPTFIVVEPARAACLFESARAGRLLKIAHGEPTVMAMLECYEPSLVAWRVLSRCADAFMTIDEDDAVDVMRRLANPVRGDVAIVAGESGGVGLGGLIKATRTPDMRAALALDVTSRILIVNTEGATDPARYEGLVGRSPAAVAA